MLEYEVEENPEAFKGEAARAQVEYGEAYDGFVVVAIEVDQGEIRRLCLERPTLKGDILSSWPFIFNTSHIFYN